MRLDAAIAHFFTGYFSTHQRSPNTLNAYTIDLRQFEEYTGEETELASIKADHMERWAASLRQADYAPASIRRKFASVRVFFNYWVRREEILRSPLWNLRLDLAPARTLPKALTLEELRRLLRQAELDVEEARDPAGGQPAPEVGGKLSPYFLALRNRAILEVMAATGIRVGETVALRISDYRASEGDLLIQGKGARERFALLCHDRPKEALEAYLEHRLRLKLDHEAMFVNTFRKPISTQTVAGTLVRIARCGGVCRKVTPHMLRHTVATLLLRCGTDLRIVQRVLGHSSVVMTTRYLHIERTDLSLVLQRYQDYI